MTGLSDLVFFQLLRTFTPGYVLASLDLCKIDKNNQTLLELRSRSVKEKNKLQDAGGEDDANESDITTAAEKTLQTDDQTTLRGKEF